MKSIRTIRSRIAAISLGATMLFGCASEGPQDSSQTNLADATVSDTPPSPDQSEVASPSPQPQTTIRFAGEPTGLSGLIPAVIEEYDLGEPHGLIWEGQHLSREEATRSLLSGQTDVGIVGAPGLLSAHQQLPDIRVIRPMYAMHGFFLAAPDSSYDGPEDLVGERVVQLGPTSGFHNATASLYEKLGLDFSSVDWVHASMPVGLVSTEQGDAAATIAWPPVGTLELSRGNFRQVFNIREEWQEVTGTDLMNGVVAVSDEWIEENPDAAAALVATLDDFVEFMHDTPELFEMPDIQELMGLEDLSAEEIESVSEAVNALWIDDWSEDDIGAQVSLLKGLREAEGFPHVDDEAIEQIWARVGES